MLIYFKKEKTCIIDDNGVKEEIDTGLTLFNYAYDNSNDYDLHEVINEVYQNGKQPSQWYIELSERTKNVYSLYNFNFTTTLIYEKNKIFVAYLVKDKRDITFVELATIIMNNKRVTKCRRCGKLFVLKNNHNARFCTRVDSVLGVPCIQIGSGEVYRQKVTENAILQEYHKAYKRLYARVRNAKMEQSDFDNWVRETTVIRDRMADEFKQTKDYQIVETFMEIVGNKK